MIRRFMHMIPNVQLRGEKKMHIVTVWFSLLMKALDQNWTNVSRQQILKTHREEGLRRFETVAHLATSQLCRKKKKVWDISCNQGLQEKKHSYVVLKAKILWEG